MAFKNTINNYGSIAKFLHWLIALIVIGLLFIGFTMGYLQDTKIKYNIYNTHKLIGLSIFFLMLFRLYWFMSNIQPTLPLSISPILRKVARGVQDTLYLLLFLMASLYADLILSPLNPDKFSVKGLKILKQEIANIKKHYKKEVNYKIFLNKYSGITTLSDKTVTTVFSDPDMEGKTLDTAVKFLQEIPNTTDLNKNLYSNLKKSAAKEDFDRLTRELLGIHPNSQRTKHISQRHNDL